MIYKIYQSVYQHTVNYMTTVPLPDVLKRVVDDYAPAYRWYATSRDVSKISLEELTSYLEIFLKDGNRDQVCMLLGHTMAVNIKLMDIFQEAGREGYLHLIELLSNQGLPLDDAIMFAARKGYLAVLKHFRNSYQHDIGFHMMGAVMAAQKEVINYFLETENTLGVALDAVARCVMSEDNLMQVLDLLVTKEDFNPAVLRTMAIHHGSHNLEKIDNYLRKHRLLPI